MDIISTVKLLFLIGTLFIHDPMTGEAYSIHEVSQIIGQTCDEAKKDYQKSLDETYKDRNIVAAEYSCELVDVDPSKDQNGTT